MATQTIQTTPRAPAQPAADVLAGLIEQALGGPVLSPDRHARLMLAPAERIRVADLVAPVAQRHATVAVGAERARICAGIRGIFGRRFPGGGPLSDALLAEVIAVAAGGPS